MTENEELRAQLATLTQQSVDQALLVDRLREGLEFAHAAAEMTYNNDKKQAFFDKYRKKYANGGCFSQQMIIDALANALSPSPQPTIGVKAMELVRKTIAWVKAEEAANTPAVGTLTCNELMELEDAAASFTPEELKILGVG